VFTEFQGYSFTPDVNGDWVINVVGQVFTDSRTVSVSGTNDRPVADTSATPLTEVGEGTIGVELNGSLSNDPDGTITSFSWVKTSGTGNISITNSNQNVATFNAPTIGPPGELFRDYVFTLTVTDNKGATDTETVTIRVTNP